MKKLALSIAVLGAIFAGLAAPATAVSWHSSSSPLKATYLGASFAEGYGNLARSGNYNRNTSYQRDPVANGNSAFVATNYYLYYSSGQVVVQGEQQTTRSSSSSYTSRYTQSALGASMTKAEGLIKVCEDFAGRPDICSTTIARSYTYSY